MTKTEPNIPGYTKLRGNQAFAALIAATIATAKNNGVQVDTKENKFKAATSLRDFAGLERAAQRAMKMRGLKYTDANFKAVVADIAANKISDEERFRGIIAFEGDATSIMTATHGIAEAKPQVPLFTLVELNDPSVKYDIGAWKTNERFVKLGAKMQLVAGASAPIIGQYLN